MWSCRAQSTRRRKVNMFVVVCSCAPQRTPWQTKRDQLNVLVKWYYRPCELPELVYDSLLQERITEEHCEFTLSVHLSFLSVASGLCRDAPIIAPALGLIEVRPLRTATPLGH
ncbi:hypothetical protein D918_03905 [Trichuris suis]|nr:hypothetical protein D918_03905 [Trichuris suis]